ncbi:hypothetical protein OUZ56_009709 [Daphnia magna]|uniref:Uncharacterized protein n=1 Tax=Daphnia magna TaxID=35525 RepID=A0ABR0AGS1_9CRUS|nr:hypothetical protein OUZ56_009709 [Daphnia magna]
MAMKRLPVTLFPPLQVQAVQRDIKAILPAGWSLSPSVQAGDTWKVYKEAKLTASCKQLNTRSTIPSTPILSGRCKRSSGVRGVNRIRFVPLLVINDVNLSHQSGDKQETPRI